MPGRVLYLDWIYEVGRTKLFAEIGPTPSQNQIIEKVREAVSALPESEQEFVRLYWFEGHSLAELSKLLGRRQHKLDGLNRRILRKLRSRLADYVRESFGVDTSESRECVICSHPHRVEIDQILSTKTEQETFRRIYRELSERLGLRISTPQILLGHMKYHSMQEVK